MAQNEVERIENIFQFISMLQDEYIDDTQRTLELAKYLCDPTTRPLKGDTNLIAVLTNFHWNHQDKSFSKTPIDIHNFMEALLVMKQLAGGGNDKPNVDTWTCLACTFVNHVDSSLCEICQSRRSSNPSAPKIEKVEETGTEAFQNTLINGSFLDILDCESEWVPAQVVRTRLSGSQRSVLVHYLEWDPQWDEWIELPSERIAQYESHKWKWRYPAGLHKTKRWDSSVYSHLAKPKRKKKRTPNQPQVSAVKHGKSAIGGVQEKKVSDAKESPKSSRPQKVVGASPSVSESSPRRPVVSDTKNVAQKFDGEEKQHNSSEKVDHLPKNLSLKSAHTPKKNGANPTINKVKPADKIALKTSLNPLDNAKEPVKKTVRKARVSPKINKVSKNDKISQNSDSVSVAPEGPKTSGDDWDLCAEFGAELQTCSGCKKMYSQNNGYMDFCQSCASSEIQSGYAVIFVDGDD